MSRRATTIFLLAIGGAVLVAVAAGLWLTGSPQSARLRRLDEDRVAELQAIARAVQDYRNRTGGMPRDPEVLTGPLSAPLNLRDPESAAPYEYAVVADRRFRVCATFAAASAVEPSQTDPERFWRHGAGRQCFTMAVPQPLSSPK